MQALDLAARLLNPILMIVLPLALGIFLTRRYRTDWGLFGVGAVTFIGSQILHIPFNAWILGPVLERLGLDGSSGGLALWLAFLALGLSAGVFEETARYLSYRYWIKEARSWEAGLTFGAGHGGAESIILGFLVFFAFLQALALAGSDLAAVIPAEQLAVAQTQLEAYWAAPWHLALLGAVERAGTLVVHMCLAVMVLQVFVRHSFLWLGLAITWHAILNALALLVLNLWGPYWAEAFVILAAVISLAIILALRRQPQGAPEQAGTPEPWTGAKSISPEPREEQLEDSRYV